MSAAKALSGLPANQIPEGVTYGPYDEPVFGKCLGINVLGARKVCSFDCPYCELGATTLRLNRLKADAELPSVKSILEGVREQMRKIHAEGPAVDTILVSGNGEPTLHPDLGEIAKGVLIA